MKTVVLVVAALCLGIGSAALADPPFGVPPGQAKKGGEPPGLAKKPYGMPPGQLKKFWKRGERMPVEYYSQPEYYIPQPQVYGLAPPPPGYRWVLVDGNGYLVATTTGLIAKVIASLIH